LAGRLIDHFGGLNGALAQEPGTIYDPDLAEACRLLRAARALFVSSAQERLQGADVRSDDRDVVEYLQLSIGSARHEQLHVIYADHCGQYLRDEIIAHGAGRRVRISARTLFHHALNLGANRLLLSHNHPSGRCEPSEDDTATTERLRSVADYLEIEVIDHLIVTSSQAFSMRAGRLL